MDKITVINASPLIFLSRGGHLNLLHRFVDYFDIEIVDIPVRGTLGLVLNAKQRGYIPSARSVLWRI